MSTFITYAEEMAAPYLERLDKIPAGQHLPALDFGLLNAFQIVDKAQRPGGPRGARYYAAASMVARAASDRVTTEIKAGPGNPPIVVVPPAVVMAAGRGDTHAEKVESIGGQVAAVLADCPMGSSPKAAQAARCLKMLADRMAAAAFEADEAERNVDYLMNF